MTYDVEDDLAATLHRRAEHDVDADALLGGALSRGRRRQRRRRMAAALGGAGVAGVATAALAGVPLVLGSGGGGAPVGSLETPEPQNLRKIGAPESPPARGDYRVAALNAAAGQGAAARPDQVGKDPTTIHFRIDSLTLPVREASWAVRPGGVEELGLQITGANGAPAGAEVRLARGAVPDPVDSGGPDESPPTTTQRPVRIGDTSGILTVIQESNGYVGHELRWTPVDDLEVVVTTSGLSEEDSIAVANAVRFDRAARCATSVQSTVLPAGATVRGCSLQLAENVPWAPRAVVMVGDGSSMLYVEVGGDPIPSKSYSASPDPVDGGDAGWIENQQVLVIYNLGGFPVHVLTTEDYGQADAELVADGLRLAPGAEVKRPETWSTRLTG